MLPALLHGKLSREQENMEDMLTSMVFGLLKYLPPSEGILPLLSNCQAPNGTRPFAELPSESRVEYEFWPKMKEGDCFACEPDVLLRIYASPNRLLIVGVEAKLHSWKSSVASEAELQPYDQLAREWDNLVRLAQRFEAEAHLVYLTAGHRLPHDDLAASQKEFIEKRLGEHPPRFSWLSWRSLAVAFRGTRNPILTDLERLAKRLGLLFFEGFNPAQKPPAFNWRFSLSERRASEPFQWITWDAPKVAWRFKPANAGRDFDWNLRANNHLAWRFESGQ